MKIDNMDYIGFATLLYIIGMDSIKDDVRPIRDFIANSVIMRKIVTFSLFLAMTKSVSIAFVLSFLMLLVC